MRQELIDGLERVKLELQWHGDFDPLNNSEHALRVAALMRVEITYDWYKSDRVIISRNGDTEGSGGWCSACYDPDPEAAMRASITSTVARMGRDLNKGKQNDLPEM